MMGNVDVRLSARKRRVTSIPSNARHHRVEQDEVGHFGRDHRQRLDAVARDDDPVTLEAQVHLDEAHDVGVVVDHQDRAAVGLRDAHRALQMLVTAAPAESTAAVAWARNNSTAAAGSAAP